WCRNSVEKMQSFTAQILRISLSLKIYGRRFHLKCGAVFANFIVAVVLFYASIYILAQNLLKNTYSPFIYFQF
ncbi:hypothetical protein ACWIUD_11710, partial [Helicobacter sp. 23-1044]